MIICCNDQESGELYCNEMGNGVFGYQGPDAPAVSLTMPVRKDQYFYNQNLHPVFDAYLPEGYLAETIKDYFRKKDRFFDNFAVFEKTGVNLKSRISVRDESESRLHVTKNYSFEEIIHGNSQTNFEILLEVFLLQSGISGVQPKVLATLRDKAAFSKNDYIIKTWGDEFPHLSENEFICLSIAKSAGLDVPPFWISDDKKLLLVEKFDFLKEESRFLGFEEACSLQAKLRDEKYDGSYEELFATLCYFSSPAFLGKTRIDFFKQFVLMHMLKNGDAHLKNFGILYDPEHIAESRKLCPTYDVVNTVVYIRSDTPALANNGKKVWLDRKQVLDFGQRVCGLTKKESHSVFDECSQAVFAGTKMIEKMIDDHAAFETTGRAMVATIDHALDHAVIER